jgi:hypothetical protein
MMEGNLYEIYPHERRLPVPQGKPQESKSTSEFSPTTPD